MKCLKLISGWSALCLLLGTITLPVSAQPHVSEQPISSASDLQTEEELIHYSDYISQYSHGAAAAEIPVDILNYSTSDQGFALDKIEGKDALLMPATGEVHFKVNVPQQNLYAIKISYYQLDGSGSEAVRTLKINGSTPFYEASVLKFPRVWNDNSSEQIRDVSGNDVLPTQEEAPRIQTIYLSNSSGLTTETLYFQFAAGESTISLKGVREPMAILSMSLETAKEPPSYQEYLEEKKSQGLKVQNKSYKIEAEYASAKSDATMYPLNDRSSPYTSPSSDRYIRYNTIGGSKWQTGGQWIEWDINVEQDGLYAISLRYSQKLKNNSTVYRKLTIDGEVPFKEAEQIPFAYTSGFEPKTLGDGNNVFYFYFTAGHTHKLRLEVVTGEFGHVLETAQQLVQELNDVYRTILMITGPKPDLYRDYSFQELIPETLEEMKLLEKELNELEKAIKGSSGWNNGSELAAVQRVARCLKDMTEDDSTIAGRFENFQESISALAAWVLESKNQPLVIDYFVIGDENTDIPQNGGFFEVLWFQIKQLVSSFVMDYNAQGQLTADEEKTITVWIQTGRDQSQIIRGLINESFTPQYNIGVRLQLVAAGGLLPAIIAGRGPDAALQLAQGEPLNYAFRNAVVDLAKFDTDGKVRSRFSEQALVPFSYEDSLYAFPESQSFQMMFYRKDILSDLGIQKSDLETWDSLYKVVIPELQKNFLSFGLLPTFTNYMTMLYQAGGQAYNDAGTNSMLNSETSVAMFTQFTKLYSEYTQPIAFDFVNRFRTGQMPLAVMDFTSYNQLSVFAPEIAGLWEMVPLPGTLDENNNLNRESVLTLTACVMFQYSERQQETFTFLDWWTSADTQIRYGKNMESIMGTAARYNSANKEAFKSVAWDENIRAAIDEQAKDLIAVPEVPGGYYTTRYFDFAYRDVVNDGVDVRTALNDAVLQIDSEIRDKRDEFGLD